LILCAVFYLSEIVEQYTYISHTKKTIFIEFSSNDKSVYSFLLSKDKMNINQIYKGVIYKEVLGLINYTQME